MDTSSNPRRGRRLGMFHGHVTTRTPDGYMTRELFTELDEEERAEWRQVLAAELPRLASWWQRQIELERARLRLDGAGVDAVEVRDLDAEWGSFWFPLLPAPGRTLADAEIAKAARGEKAKPPEMLWLAHVGQLLDDLEIADALKAAGDLTLPDEPGAARRAIQKRRQRVRDWLGW